MSACLVIITLNLALCVVDLGSYFKKRCLHETLEFKAEATVMCLGFVCFLMPVVYVYICP